MKILMIGPQGSGKGTIGEMLSKYFELPLVSVGQLLRDLPKDSHMFKEMDDFVRKGLLAPNDKVAEMLKEETARDIYKNGYIFDGWARQFSDLVYFDPGFDKVVFLKISTETTLKRLSTRRTCSKCGAVYNVITVPPKVDGICDVCGGTLIQRADDTEDAIKKRLEIFNKDTQPVIEYFKKQGNLLEVDGEGSPQEVFDLVLKAMDL